MKKLVTMLGVSYKEGLQSHLGPLTFKENLLCGYSFSLFEAWARRQMYLRRSFSYLLFVHRMECI